MSITTNQQERLETLDAYFQERCRQIPVLAQRAEDEGIAAIRSTEDLAPLMFPHQMYKSYPESLVANGKWAQMNRWLDSLSTYRVTDVDVSGVGDVDGWLERLASVGFLVSSSSGTSGKASFLNATQKDRDAARADLARCYHDVTGLAAEPSYRVFVLGPETTARRLSDTRTSVNALFNRPDWELTLPGAPPEGHHSFMTRLSAIRRAMADGTARPDEIAQFEAEAAERQRAVEGRMRLLAEKVLAMRDEPLFFFSIIPIAFQLIEALRELGAAEGDLSASNVLMAGGGLKGAVLPADHLSQIHKMLNIQPDRFVHYYAMTELNTRFAKCSQGRYHVPEHVTLLVLEKDGEALAPFSGSEVEGRAAFCDTTIDGRWGGTMSGDKIRADFGACACGRPGPSVDAEISRYKDLPDGDKITCAGTMDAYVRGFIAD